MKKINFLLASIIINCTVFGQNKNLVVPPHTIDVSNISLSSNMISPNPSGNSIIGDGVFDNSGNIIFYVLDNYIYNNLGTSIGGFQNMHRSPNNFQIVPVPSSCNSFYVISTSQNPYSNNQVYYSEVQINGNTAIVNPSKNNIQISFGIGNGSSSIATSLLNSNNERYLYVASYGVHKYIISNSGINFSNSLFPNGSILEQGYSRFGGELEISSDNSKLALSTDSDIFVFDLDVNGNYLNSTKYNIPNANNASVTGLEFSDNNSKLWVSVGTGNPNQANLQANEGVNIIDLTAPPTNFIHINNSSDYSKSHIEKIYNGNILLRSSTNLVQINPITLAISNSLPINAIEIGNNPYTANSNTFPLPNQLDFEMTTFNQNNSSAMASATFVNPNRIIQMNSKYGPGDVAVLCLSDDLLVDGSGSSCEDRYFVGLSEFDLNNWNDIQVLHSNWVSTSTPAPNNIRITDFLPLGYQLRPNIVYKFRLAVGIPWQSTDIFFMIDCCSSKPKKKTDILKKKLKQ